MLKAARDAGVKRVVMTSSISAIIFGRGFREKLFAEADWTDETNRDDGIVTLPREERGAKPGSMR